jgi:hypothetical protein
MLVTLFAFTTSKNVYHTRGKGFLFLDGDAVPRSASHHSQKETDMKSSLTRYEIRLNLIDLVIEHVKDVYQEPAPDEGQKSLLELLNIYRADTVRIMRGESGSLDYLFDNRKVGVRLAGLLMEQVLENESQSLIGWYQGVEPNNMVQFLYNLMAETALELSWSIQQIESYHPHLQAQFDLERAAYQRIHLQWQKEDDEAGIRD